MSMDRLPPTLARLPERARTLWWSWHPQARRLFDTLTGSAPEPRHDNPFQLLHGLPPEELEAPATGGRGAHGGCRCLYRVLETGVIPLYYDRDADGIPARWLRVVKGSIQTCAPPSVPVVW